MKAKVLSSVSVTWGFLAVLSVLMIPSFAVAQLGDLPIVEPVETAPAVAATPLPAASSLCRVHLAVDGNVPGSVKVQTKLGTPMPVRATISVFRDGLLVSTTHANEQGRFQLPGLLAGTYSVIADASSHMGVFAVEVLPYKREATAVTPVALTAAGEGSPDGEMSLDLVLATEADDEPMDPLLVDPMYAPMMSGGGGGGGGGGGMLLGLAGLAGLAGLGGLGGGGTASSATP